MKQPKSLKAVSVLQESKGRRVMRVREYLHAECARMPNFGAGVHTKAAAEAAGGLRQSPLPRVCGGMTVII